MSRTSDTSGASEARPSRGALIADFAVLAVGLIVLYAIPHDVRGDGLPRFDALERMLHGHLYSTRYSVVGPIFALPLLALGHLVGEPKLVCGFFNVLLFTASLPILARELRLKLPADTVRTFLLVLVFGSMFPSHIQFFYGEVFTALTMTWGILLLSRRKSIGWLLIVLGAVNTPGTLFGVAFLAIREAVRTRRLRHLAWPVLVVILTRVECLVMRGSLFATGYEGDSGFPGILPYSGLPGFSYPFFFGFLSITLSFGKGLVFFAPGMLLPLRKGTESREKDGAPHLRWAWVSMLLVLFGLVLLYSRWWSWPGGWFWGPRFFLIASLPASIGLSIYATTPERRSLLVNLACFVALALSFWVGVNGLIFDTSGLEICQVDGYRYDAFCDYTPELSVLWHPFVDFASTVPPKTRPLALVVCGIWALVFFWTSRRVARVLANQIREFSRRQYARHIGHFANWRV